MRYGEETERLGEEMQSSQLTDEEPDDITQDRLQQLRRLIEDYPKLAALLFEDQANFQPTIQSMKDSGNQLLYKLHNLDEEVAQIRMGIQDAILHYDGRRGDGDERVEVRW